MASPEPEESWSNHIHTHTPARTHTRTHSHTGARRARLILAGAKKKKNVYMYIYPRLSDLCYFFFLFFKGWIRALKNVAGFGLAGGGARRARALLLSCAVRSAAPGGPARPLVRPRSLVLPPPLHGRAPPRAPAAAPLRPPASPASAGVGSGPCACLPRPLPSPGVLVKGRGRARAGEGGGSQRPRGRAKRGPPPRDLPRRRRGRPHGSPHAPGAACPARAGGGAASNERATSPSTLPLSVNFGEFRSIGGSGALAPGEGKQFVEADRGPLAAPRAPPASQRPRGPVAPVRQSQPRRLGGRGDRRGLGAGSRAQHCHYLTQQEQCWGGAARGGARCDRLSKLGIGHLMRGKTRRGDKCTLACGSLFRVVERIRRNVFSLHKI
nr:translation initiation factor IF-2-like [Equus asinus]